MSLTGRSLLILLAVLAVAAPIAGVRMWSAWTGRGRTAFRIGLFAVAQLAAVAVSVAAANDYGQFYPTWSDLLRLAHPSTEGSDVTVRSFGALSEPAAANAAELSPSAGDLSASDARAVAAALHPLSPPDEWAKQGVVVRLPVPGDGGAAPQLVLAYLPPSYFSGGPGAARLPVVELLTGYPGTPTSLLGKIHAVDAQLAGLADGTVSPMVFVMTRPVEPYPRDTECMDIPGGPQNMHFLAHDVPRSAAEVLRLSVPALGVMGYSSGGYCALKLAMTFPRIFVGAGSLSGYYAAEPGAASGGDLFGGDRRVRQEADLNWRLDHLPPPETAVVLATARDEGGRDGYRPAENFLGRVRAPMTADEIIRAHGGHNFGTWSAEFPDMLRWMDRRLKAATGDARAPRTFGPVVPAHLTTTHNLVESRARARSWATPGSR